MSKIFKRKRKDQKTGKIKLARTYTLKYKMPGMLKPLCYPLGVTDKQVAVQLAREFIVKQERILAGLEEVEKPKPKTLLDLLPQYLAEKAPEVSSAQYLSDLKSRIKRLIRDCCWAIPADIKPGDFTAWRADVEENFKPKTLNDYLDAIVGFTKCCLYGSIWTRCRLRGSQSYQRRASRRFGTSSRLRSSQGC
ncbi:MAG: hypothetical protein JKX85_01060 [Phycisphaeraceae bacterium]|nr:hypothetical protein [Phycisphaeraceae bacterium]